MANEESSCGVELIELGRNVTYWSDTEDEDDSDDDVDYEALQKAVEIALQRLNEKHEREHAEQQHHHDGASSGGTNNDGKSDGSH